MIDNLKLSAAHQHLVLSSKLEGNRVIIKNSWTVWKIKILTSVVPTRDKKWVRAPNTPTQAQKKKIFSMAIAYVYAVGDEFFLQARGGPIGLILTGVLARVFMMSWDKW